MKSHRPLVRRALKVALPLLVAGAVTAPAIAGSPSVKKVKPNSTLFRNNLLLRAPLADMVKAARTCDLDTQRQAFHRLESVWNSVEGYIQFMSVERYNFFEHVYLEDQVERGTGITGDPVLACGEMVDATRRMASTWEEILAFELKSAHPGPLFDDVTTLRTINQGIRLARAALDGNPEARPQTPSEQPDPAAAEAAWKDGFDSRYATARRLIDFRNPELAKELDGLVAKVNRAFSAPAPYPAASEALAALSSRYTVGLNLVHQAARNVIHTRTAFDPDALEQVGTVGDVLAGLAGMRDAVADHRPGKVESIYADAVQGPLSFKTGGPLARADAAMTAAVDSYVTAQNAANTRALLDQIDIAEQSFIGQFWGTDRLEKFLAGL